MKILNSNSENVFASVGADGCIRLWDIKSQNKNVAQ